MTVSEEQGAMTRLYVATHPLALKVDGSYFDACLPVSPSRKATLVINCCFFVQEIMFYVKWCKNPAEKLQSEKKYSSMMDYLT